MIKLHYDIGGITIEVVTVKIQHFMYFKYNLYQIFNIENRKYIEFKKKLQKMYFNNDAKYFSYDFRLEIFVLKIKLYAPKHKYIYTYNIRINYDKY